MRFVETAGACAVALVLQAVCAGQVVHDGTLGPAGGPLVAPHFQIAPDRGRLVGSNLFHSFSTFNLAPDESANFTGPPSVHNVLARVTGGSPSNIAGTIRSDIANANVYLINPSGIVFTEGARLDVGGSFAAVTADVVHLADGGRFDARVPAESVLTSAAPSAFGFLSPNPAGVQVIGSQSNRALLNVRAGKTLSIVGGNVRLRDARLKAPDGRINVVSLDAPANVALDPTRLTDAVNLADPITNASADAGGDIEMQRLAELNTDGSGGGRIVIRAGRLFMAQPKAILSADTLDAGDGLGIDIDASRSFKMLGRSNVVAFVTGSGTGGDIEVRSPLVVLDGRGVPDDVLGLSTATQGSGRGGDVRIDADAVRIRDASKISSETFGTGGRGGNIQIVAGKITIDATRDPNNDTSFTGLAARTKDLTDANGNVIAPNSGRAGDIVIDCDELRLTKGGKIAVDTFGAGPAGVVTIRARSALLKGALPQLSAGISAGSRVTSRGRGGQVNLELSESLTITDLGAITASSAGSGRGGDLNVTADSLVMSGGARVSADTTGAASGGNLVIRARSLLLDGPSPGVEADAEISAATRRLSGGGAGGELRIDTTDLTIRRGAAISVTTFGDGKGGNVVIAAPGGSVLLDGEESRGFTGVAAQTRSTQPGAGRGGSIAIDTRNLQVLRGAQVSANTFGAGDGGNVRVTADSVRIDAGAQPGATAITASSRGASPITDVELQLDIRHTFDADLRGTLTSPEGTTLVLFDRAGADGDHFLGTVFDDDAPEAIAGGTAPFAGRFQPQQPLRRLAGQDANGVWQLELIDDFLGDGGSLRSWSLRVNDRAFVSADVPRRIPEFGSVRSSLPVKLPALSAAGRGGSIRIETGDLIVLRGGKVSAVTLGTGAGGDITVIASRNIRLDDDGYAGAFTGIVADTESTVVGAGRGGDITVRAGDVLDVRNLSGITANSLGAGAGGSVDVAAGSRLRIRDGGILSATSLGDGSAGGVDVRIDGPLDMTGAASIAVSSDRANAGNIFVESGRFLRLTDSTVSARSGGDGGNITLNAPQRVHLVRSTVTAEAQGSGENAQILIDPRTVILNKSVINGRAGGDDVTVRIVTQGLLVSNDSRILTDRPAFSIDAEVVSALVGLRASLENPTLGLQPLCAQRVEDETLSSFLFINRQGVPAEPGAWKPSLYLVEPVWD